MNIITFCCNHCSYEAADKAGGLRKKYFEDVKIIRVPCTGRIELEFILKALEKGADGVLILGCHPGNCHYKEGNITAFKRFVLIKEVLTNLGMEDAVSLAWISSDEAERFVEVVNNFARNIRKMLKLKVEKDFELRTKKVLESP